ncbi:MAG: hypothetical protein Q8O46_02845 [bacterium]|nr:hypothetical protein [bacterium]
MRINLVEIKKIPAYLSKYESVIKFQAVKHLTRHFLDTQWCTGIGETLTLDDYGITYSIASLSPEGRNLIPKSETGGPLAYCFYPNLVRYIPLAYDIRGNVIDGAYFVNAYIQLLDPIIRRNLVAKTLERGGDPYRREDPRKKGRFANFEPIRRKEAFPQEMKEMMATEFKKAIHANHYPTLPTGSGVTNEWSQGGEPEVPDQL